MNLTRFSRWLHSWAGLLFSLLILLVGITGTLLVWKEDYLWLSIEEARQDFDATPEALADIVEQTLTRFEPRDILLIQFASENLALNKIYLSEGRYAYTDISGNLIDLWTLNGRWEEWLYDLHHRLLLENTGLLIVGFLAMAMIPFMLLGTIAFWPTRNAFSRGLLVRGTTRPLLLLLHRNLGVVATLPLMLTFVTGVTLAFPDEAQQLLVESAQSTDEYQERLTENVDALYGEEAGHWLPALERVQNRYPNGKIRSVIPDSYFSVYKVFGIQQQGDWHQSGLTRIYIDGEAGYMDLNMNARGYPLLEQAYNLSYPLHTAKTGSKLYQLFATLIGLALCALALLGLVSYGKKLAATRHKKGSKQ